MHPPTEHTTSITHLGSMMVQFCTGECLVAVIRTISIISQISQPMIGVECDGECLTPVDLWAVNVNTESKIPGLKSVLQHKSLNTVLNRQ